MSAPACVAAADEAPSAIDLTLAGVLVIGSGRRTLIPGLIDVHWLTLDRCNTHSVVVTGYILEVAIYRAQGVEHALVRGFTAIRDLGKIDQKDDRSW